MSQGRGPGSRSNNVQRETSILSYFPKKNSDTTDTGFDSAKSINQPTPVSRSSSTTSSTTWYKSHPFTSSKSTTSQITNDSKYINTGLYGDQKLIFSSHLTAKRPVTSPTPPKQVKRLAPKDGVSDDVIDLTVADATTGSHNSTPNLSLSGIGHALGSNPIPKHNTEASGNPQYPSGKVQSTGPSSALGIKSANRLWKPLPSLTNRSSTTMSMNSTIRSNHFQSSPDKSWAMDQQPLKQSHISSIASSTQSSSMFGNPVLSSQSRLSKKRVLPSSTFTEAKRGRTFDSSPSSSQRSTTPITRIGEYSLSAEQNTVLQMALYERQSLFFTGSAGTGKSVLLREIIAQMQKKYGSGIAITASTGIAACNIGGLTLHSFAGIGLGHDSVEKLVKRITSMKQVYRRWTSISVLVIDEISMIDADLFDKLEQIARQVRRNTKPFGGIQLILTGDFFQLPPVGKDKISKYCFDAQSWIKVVDKNVMLTHVFRQKDGDFVRMLNEMRLNQMSTSTIEKFMSLSRTPKYADDSIEPTRLFSLRNQVEAANNDRLRHLTGPTHRYTANDWGDQAKLNGCMAPVELELKMDAQVMLIKNLNSSLVNGSTGIVIGFTNEGQFKSESSIRSRLLEKERSNNTLTGGRNEEVIIPTEVYPIVRFVNGQEVVIQPERWEVELPGGTLAATRTQVPLMLAWALSIHKSQGQTLDRVFVDLGSVFEKGQAYVALSRATDMNSLQVLHFDPSKVVADHRVVEFYQQLSCV